MDRALAKAVPAWPDVPACCGWLRLDARGRWLLRTGGAEPPQFAPVTHRGLIEFLGRHYGHDAAGRWFVQNGPQRVYVGLDYTPVVYRIADDGRGLVAHSSVSAGASACVSVGALLFDESGSIVADAEPGPGVVLDRDLAGLLAALTDEQGGAIDVEAAALPGRGRLFGQSVSLERVARAGIVARFGYDCDPGP